MSWVITGREAGPADPFIGSVSLLLHGNQSGGQFVDSSPTPKIITKVGDAAPGSPGGGTPIYPSNNSAFGNAIAFDGTGDYLTVTPTTDLAFDTGSFTVECWFYANSLSAGSYAALMGFHDAIDINTWAAYVQPNGIFMYGSAGTLTGGGTISTSTWHHYAATRSGNTLRVFLNGVQEATATVTGIYASAESGFRVGDDLAASNPPFNGYIDDLRITKGIARYTANFTPPAAPFPDI
jgi:hypothetical protein